MPEMTQDEFKFPDENAASVVKLDQNTVIVDSDPGAFEVEIEDDTPEEDRGRSPSDPNKVKKLEIEVDDLDKYSKEAKDKLIRMKRVWNDERRAKEAAERERQAAIEALQAVYGQYNQVKQVLQTGEEEYKEAMKIAAKAELSEAKRAYKEAYDKGDSDAIAEAQEEMTKAQLKLEKVKK